MEHAAVHSEGIDWQNVQFLESTDEGPVVRTMLVTTESPFCDTKPSNYHMISSTGMFL